MPNTNFSDSNYFQDTQVEEWIDLTAVAKPSKTHKSATGLPVLASAFDLLNGSDIREIDTMPAEFSALFENFPNFGNK